MKIFKNLKSGVLEHVTKVKYMKIFKNLKSGVLEHVTNEKLIPQYEKYTDVYELVKNEEANNEPTLKELKEQADALGVKYTTKVTKAKLLELIANTNAE